MDVKCDGDAMVRLKRLGICNKRTIEVIQVGDPMVLRVIGSRLGVSRRLAESVIVDTLSQTTTLASTDTVQNV